MMQLAREELRSLSRCFFSRRSVRRLPEAPRVTVLATAAAVTVATAMMEIQAMPATLAGRARFRRSRLSNSTEHRYVSLPREASCGRQR
jgi:hypothetical protein